MQTENLVGREFDGIILQERRQQGYIGTRYRGYHAASSTMLTIYLMRINARDEKLLQRFEQATAELQMLDHPYIQPLRYSGIQDGYAYLAFDMITGRPLADYLGNQPNPPLADIRRILHQLAQALSYAHARGVFHHDLKTSGIWLDQDDNIALARFGVGRKLLGNDLISSREGLLGTPSYMPPEQIRGEETDARADVYSLGAILYQMLTGRLPFSMDGDALAIINRHVFEQPPPIQDINPNVPASLIQLVEKAMAKHPTDRYQTAQQFDQALIKAMDNIHNGIDLPRTRTGEIEAVHISDTPPPFSPSTQSKLSDNMRIGIVAVTALFILGVLAWVGLTATAPPAGVILADETTTAAEIKPNEAINRRARLALNPGESIAHIACNRSSEFHAARAADLKALADARRLPLRIYDNDSDPTREVANLRSALTDNARALIVCVVDAASARPLLEQAAAEGVHIVLDTAELQGQLDAVFVYTDNYDMGYAVGQAAGEFAAQNLDEVTAAILDFPALESIVNRADGLEAGLVDAYPQAAVVGRWQGATQDNGESAMQQIIAAHPDVNMILSINDAGAYGAIEVLDRQDVPPGAVHIFSIDAEQIAREHIDNGYYLRGSLTVPREASSQAMMDAVMNLLGSQAIAQNVISVPGTVYMGGSDGR